MLGPLGILGKYNGDRTSISKKGVLPPPARNSCVEYTWVALCKKPFFLCHEARDLLLHRAKALHRRSLGNNPRLTWRDGLNIKFMTYASHDFGSSLHFLSVYTFYYSTSCIIHHLIWCRYRSSEELVEGWLVGAKGLAILLGPSLLIFLSAFEHRAFPSEFEHQFSRSLFLV